MPHAMRVWDDINMPVGCATSFEGMLHGYKADVLEQ